MTGPEVATVYALPAELTIYTVGELHPQWMAWLSADHAAELDDEAGDEPFVLDGSTVEQADAAGVQLLLSLAAALKQRGRRLALRRPGPALAEACASLGLADWLSRLDHPQTELA